MTIDYSALRRSHTLLLFLIITTNILLLSPISRVGAVENRHRFYRDPTERDPLQGDGATGASTRQDISKDLHQRRKEWNPDRKKTSSVGSGPANESSELRSASEDSSSENEGGDPVYKGIVPANNGKNIANDDRRPISNEGRRLASNGRGQRRKIPNSAKTQHIVTTAQAQAKQARAQAQRAQAQTLKAKEED